MVVPHNFDVALNFVGHPHISALLPNEKNTVQNQVVGPSQTPDSHDHPAQ